MSNSQQRNTKYRQKAMARYDNGDNQKLVRRKRKKHNFKKDLSTEHISKKSKGDTIMTNNKANKSKVLALILGLTMCLALMLGIVFASPANTVYAAGEDGTAPTIVCTGGIDVDRKNHMGNLPAAIKTVATIKLR